MKINKNITGFQAFLQGVGSILNLFPGDMSDFTPRTFEDDAKAIDSDWQAVYGDLYYAECYFDNKNKE